MECIDKEKEPRALKIISYNCKNVKTGAVTLQNFLIENDIIMLQEHWLFHSQISHLGEINKDIGYCGKGTDMNNPILPTQMPRGFGGVGIIWKSEMNPFIAVVEDGGNRIQCAHIKNFSNDKGLFIVSLYLPSKGLSQNTEDFCTCIDQLREIMLKYAPTN